MSSKISIILSFIIIFIIINISENIKHYEITEKQNLIKIKEFIKGENYNKDTSYYAVLEIPKINLLRGLYEPTSNLNNVDINLEFVNSFDINTNSNIAIMGHSGNSNKSYFKDLINLDIGDTIYFYFERVKYEFKIYDIYTIIKDQPAEIRRNNELTITLITCYLDNEQLIILAGKEKEFNL